MKIKFSSRSAKLLEEGELGTSCLAGDGRCEVQMQVQVQVQVMEDQKCRRKVDNSPLFCRQSGLADLGTSGWGAPSAPKSATVVPNRTGMRETESTAGRSSIQVFCISPVNTSSPRTFRYGRTRRSCWPSRMRAWTCCMTLWLGKREWDSKYLER